jgi:flagellar motor switch protein FliN/FliY
MQKWEFIDDLPLTLKVVFGDTRMTIRDFLELEAGSVIEFEKMAGDPIDLYMNGRLIAKGEAVVQNEMFAIRLIDIVSNPDILDGD